MNPRPQLRTAQWIGATLLAWMAWSTQDAGAAVTPTFDQQFLATPGDVRAFGVGVADFNGDLIDDILAADLRGDMRLFTGNGDGTFTPRGIVVDWGFHNAYGMAVGDFNGDGNVDFVLPRTDNGSNTVPNGQINLYLGNGDGTFQFTPPLNGGIVIGDAGINPVALTAGDVDGDGDIDLIAGDIDRDSLGLDHADVTLFRNRLAEDGAMSFLPEVLISVQNLGAVPNPEAPPYYPPNVYMKGYGLALGDVDGDLDLDLLVSDVESYLYLYLNNGAGAFAPLRFEAVAGLPFAYGRLHESSTTQMALSVGDFNDDGLLDIVAGGTDGAYEGVVDLWLGIGPDGDGFPAFQSAGPIGGSGTDARGLAVGQFNPLDDAFLDVVFGNGEGDLNLLFGFYVAEEEEEPIQAEILAQDQRVECQGESTPVILRAGLFTEFEVLPGETIDFTIDADGDGIDETYSALTDDQGIAEVAVDLLAHPGDSVKYVASWQGEDGASAVDDATIVVVDTTPPVIADLSASPDILWPPLGQMVRVRVRAEAEDNCDPDPSCRIVSVVSSDDDTLVQLAGWRDWIDQRIYRRPRSRPDIEITGDMTLKLRAERDGRSRQGRVYTITVECSDASGNVSQGQVEVLVPHDLRSLIRDHWKKDKKNGKDHEDEGNDSKDKDDKGKDDKAKDGAHDSRASNRLNARR
jgi:hypothetical protein